MKFVCDFGRGITCGVEIADQWPGHGHRHIRKCEWNGKPTLAVLRKYVSWMNCVNQTLADKWGVKLAHIFQITPRWQTWELWVYEPGGEPKKSFPTSDRE